MAGNSLNSYISAIIGIRGLIFGKCTHFCENFNIFRTLDLVLSKSHCRIFRDNSPLVTEDKHHPALLIHASTCANHFDNFPNKSSQKSYNFKRANFPALYSSILEADWSFLSEFQDVNLACDAFYIKLYTILDIHVPQYKNFKRKYPVWYSSELKSTVRSKEHYHRQYKKSHCEEYLTNFKQSRALAKTLSVRDYRHYVENIENSIKSDPSSFWSFVNNKRGKTRLPGRMHYNDTELNNPQAIVEAFSNYFSSVFLQPSDNDNTNTNFEFDLNLPDISIRSLSEEEIILSIKKLKNKMTTGPDHIPSFFVRDCAYVLCQPLRILFNLSLKQGVFPDIWKNASVCPILKQGDSSDIANYRPITLLCNFAKAFEVSLYNRIYPLTKNILTVDQHGFMNKRSTNTNLLCFTQYLSRKIDQQGQVDAIYTDFSKAFDRINHTILLAKLDRYGFSHMLVNLFSSYLSNRLQYVTYNGFKSSTYSATSGVPQGSNMGPLLFSLFINDIDDILKCDKLLFADDLKIFAPINSVDDCSNLQSELNKLVGWCGSNHLSLNISKCKVITYSRKANSTIYDYHIDSQSLSRTDSTKDLGIYFDNKLTFSKHIDTTVSSSMRTLGFILRLGQDFRSNDVLIKLFFTYVRSKLEYCSLTWNPIYDCHIQSIESVQRKFLKYLTFRIDGRYPHRGIDNSYLLKSFNFNSLKFRRHFYSLKFLYLLLHNNVDCSDILSQLNFLIPRVSNRNSLTFYNPAAHTNLMLKSPIYVMCSNYNSICHICDIFTCTLNNLYSTFRTCSML